MANESDIYLEELSIAIKSLQIKSLLQSDEKTHVITFSKQDDFKALNYFCLTLDKIFMHGLRNKDNGYWMFVKSFCTRDMIHQIIQLKAVQTNIGRGRTWLFMILNEKILDGYLTTFQHNPMIIQEYYHSFALLCSPQLMLLQSLICGLEHVHFKIETDTHYWDAPDFPTYIPSFPNYSESNSRRNILH
uniref:RUN domain-containing protein n=1 Tax=Ciona savignyi TaxID=51511 RepID=H2ZDK0_CIOSA